MINKKAQMEMSIGTIVTIVLLVTLLVLGIILIQNIFKVAKGTVNLTEKQINDQIGKMFSTEDIELVIYPETRFIQIKQGSSDGIAVGIKNLGGDEDEYSYTTRAEIGKDCPSTFTEQKALDLIVIGETRDKIVLSSGIYTSKTIDFKVPSSGVPLCTVEYTIALSSKSGKKFEDYFKLEIKAK